jgi:hypothetical protein
MPGNMYAGHLCTRGGSVHPKITHELLIDLHAYRQAQMIDLAAPGSCTGNEPDPRPAPRRHRLTAAVAVHRRQPFIGSTLLPMQTAVGAHA